MPYEPFSPLTSEERVFSPFDGERLTRPVSESDDRRLLRRLVPPVVITDHVLSVDQHVAVLIDIETIASSQRRPEIIEVAMMAIVYDDEGRLGPTVGMLEQFQKPSGTLNSMAVRLTGLTDSAVAGHHFDRAAIGDMLDIADLVVARHAVHDRPLLENLHWDFSIKPWACLTNDVPWIQRGYDSCRLASLAAYNGLSFKPHRAIECCAAMAAVLAATTPRQPSPAFIELLASVRRESVQIDAISAPYALRDLLKRRRYRWCPEADGSPAAWRIEVAPENLDAELAWLDHHIYRGSDVSPLQRKVTAVERYRAP